VEVNSETMTSLHVDQVQHPEIVGLIPAGGEATRISPLPCSKEIYPIGFRQPGEGQGLRPKAVCLYLLEKMRLAGAAKAYIILRQGKYDIPAYLGDGSMLEMHLAYLMMNLPFGAPYTLDQAYPFVQDAMVVFGFPDIIFEPDNAFEQLLSRQSTTRADVVLGLFPTDQPHKMDMVDLDKNGRIRRIVIKPDRTELRYTWIIAVWTAEFTRFMHTYLAAQTSASDIIDEEQAPPELFVGDVIRAAIHAGMQVETVLFPEGVYLDIGTPEDLVKAVQQELAQVI
jgi:glucose-1-phosphate thymidylyltransferase